MAGINYYYPPVVLTAAGQWCQPASSVDQDLRLNRRRTQIRRVVDFPAFLGRLHYRRLVRVGRQSLFNSGRLLTPQTSLVWTEIGFRRLSKAHETAFVVSHDCP
jgi:hypothetical protein